MAAPSPVLYALHHSLEPQGFERLCVDLLVREGYARIVPGGKSRDHGRDAEVRYWIEPNQGSPQIAFQFSQDSKWEPKLRKDISKITQHCTSIERIVFVSSRSITVEKQDKIREEYRRTHQVTLEILDEGWFRIRLEEDHADLALKHLGVTVEPTPGFHATQVKMYGLTDENKEEILRHRSPEELRATLTAQTQADPSNAGAWKGLAHVCYFLHDYESSLLSVTRALRNSRDEVERWNLIALKASIIAEQGIESGSRLLLKKAMDLFTTFVDKLGRSIDHYNLANILAALGRLAEAEVHYRLSVDLDPSYAPAWKNLGSLLVKLRRSEEGMECLDTALKLNPDLLEALCTKANVLVMSEDDCSEAIELMDRAFEIDPDIEKRWPHAHYWYAMALCRQDRHHEALAIVEDRLERKYDCPYLGRLAVDILAHLWRSDPSHILKAEKFFSFRIDAEERSYRVLIEMLDLFVATDREEEAWSLLDRFLGAKELSSRLIAERVPFSIADLTNSFVLAGYYREYRSASSLADYAHVLDGWGLRPHDEVPTILFHLLIPAFFKIAIALQDADLESDLEDELEVVLDTYRLISRIFAAFGGALLSQDTPSSQEKQLELIAGALIAGQDIPLMEVSRFLGFLWGQANRDLPKEHRDSIVNITAAIHEEWITEFLGAVGSDWNIECWKKEPATNPKGDSD